MVDLSPLTSEALIAGLAKLEKVQLVPDPPNRSSRIEIPQRSSLLPYLRCAIFLSEAGNFELQGSHDALLRLRVEHAMESYQGALPGGEVCLQSATAELPVNVLTTILTEQ